MEGSFEKWFSKPGIRIQVLVVFIYCFQSLAAAHASGFSPEKAGFSVKFKDEVSPYRVIGVYVLPQETLTVEVQDKDKRGQYVLHASAGKATQIEEPISGSGKRHRRQDSILSRCSASNLGIP